jgi:hypothetical protein
VKPRVNEHIEHDPAYRSQPTRPPESDHLAIQPTQDPLIGSGQSPLHLDSSLSLTPATSGKELDQCLSIDRGVELEFEHEPACYQMAALSDYHLLLE